MVDPCIANELLTTFDEKYLYAVIGSGVTTYEFRSFDDSSSLRVDPLLGYEPVGYFACEERLYEVAEIRYSSPSNDTIASSDDRIKYI